MRDARVRKRDSVCARPGGYGCRVFPFLSVTAPVPLAFARARSYVIFATGDNTAWALDALAGSNGAPLWQVSDLPIVPVAPALVTNESAWWAGAPSSFGSGWLGVWRMDWATSSSPKITSLTAGGSCAADASVAVLAPLAALPVGLLGGATVALVTTRGCVVGEFFDMDQCLACPAGTLSNISLASMCMPCADDFYTQPTNSSARL